ncbi:hypothetical protein STEG23_000805 [Scotinomys teguina]
MSNLLQLESVTSAPIHDNVSDHGKVSLKDLFDHAIALSQTTSALTMEMRKLFVLDFLKDKTYMNETLNSCHTFSLKTPETVEEARDISVHPGLEENETYPDWNDLDSLRAADEESHFFALYKLSYCLRVDTYTIAIYLKHLRCVLVNDDSCYAEEF